MTRTSTHIQSSPGGTSRNIGPRTCGSALLLALLVVMCSSCALPETSRPQLASCGAIQHPTDRARIFLLTMGPGDRVWNVFGHSALWLSLPGGQSWVYNFGVIRTDQPDLMSRFIQGIADFYLETRTFEGMVEYYLAQDRTVVVQQLDLPESVIHRISSWLQRESRPENRDYRYHWMNANCTTRLRDLLDHHFDGDLRRQFSTPVDYTARDEVLRHLALNWPLWFGWHFTVSGAADRALDHWEAMFLPDRLFDAARVAHYRENDSEIRPLVSHECELLLGGNPWAPARPPNWSWICLLLGTGLAALLRATGWNLNRRRLSRCLFGILTILLGLGGSALAFASSWAWYTSTYEGFHHNFNLFLVNPGWLLLVPIGVAVAFRWRKLLAASKWVSATLFLSALIGSVLTLSGLAQQSNRDFVFLFLPVLFIISWTLKSSKIESPVAESRKSAPVTPDGSFKPKTRRAKQQRARAKRTS